MVSVLLISHGDMADAMVRSAEMIVGHQAQVEGLSLLPTDSAEEFRRKVKDKIAELRSEDGLIILSDFPLGTPFNAVVQVNKDFCHQHLTGMNMPMLLSILRNRMDPAVTAVELGERALHAVERESFSVNQFVKALNNRQE